MFRDDAVCKFSDPVCKFSKFSDPVCKFSDAVCEVSDPVCKLRGRIHASKGPIWFANLGQVRTVSRARLEQALQEGGAKAHSNFSADAAVSTARAGSGGWFARVHAFARM